MSQFEESISLLLKLSEKIGVVDAVAIDIEVIEIQQDSNRMKPMNIL